MVWMVHVMDTLRMHSKSRRCSNQIKCKRISKKFSREPPSDGEVIEKNYMKELFSINITF